MLWRAGPVIRAAMQIRCYRKARFLRLHGRPAFAARILHSQSLNDG